jgi:uncharacterized protein (DUF58 family)
MKSAKEILQRVKQIELKTKWQTKELFGGEYHSAFKGRGMSFSEVREYQYGDDVRNIDWNVTARTNSPHVKVFEEERELNVIIVADYSPSMFFGLKYQYKIESLIEIAAAIAFSAVKNQDKVGLAIMGNDVEKYIHPRKGRPHMMKLITDMVMHERASTQANLSKVLEHIHIVEKKRSIIFILSDFMTEGYESQLNILSRKHDVIGIKIFDEYERNLPAVGLINITDIETGSNQWLDTDDPSIRSAFAYEYTRYQQLFDAAFIKANADTINVASDDDYIKVLQSFFHNRARR